MEKASIMNQGALRIFDRNIMIVYDCKTGEFTYPDRRMDSFNVTFDNRPIWQIMVEDGVATKATADEFEARILEMAASDSPGALYADYAFKDVNDEWKWYGVGFICAMPKEKICITFTDIHSDIEKQAKLVNMSEYDELTGLYNRKGFTRKVEEILEQNKEEVIAGEYALGCFDVLRFKAINDLFGITEGDKVLAHIAEVLSKTMKENDVICHPGSDRFIFFTHTSGEELKDLVEKLIYDIADYNLPFEIACNVGLYVTGGTVFSVDSMIDRAVLAQSVIKGSYSLKYNFYTEELRNNMLGEQEIVGMMSGALADRQFVVYYQPQYSHSTGMLLGAEALVRWKHPEKGLISPGIFIPIFEKNGFISRLDLYVFEQVCAFIRKCIDKKLVVVPISTNFSRHDIFMPDFVERLEAIRDKYDVPVKYLRVEITESVVMGSSSIVNEVVKKLHSYGYVVEMDDFGSGYSSLNVLKDIELDVIKLDMMFLSEKEENNKGGTILSSVVRMAKWLEMPVIAEGVETVKQADFLRSIGCDYIQGYLYSRPIPEEEFENILGGSTVGATVPQMRLIDTLNAYDFWDPKSQETLIFSNYVGGAAIFDYRDGKIEILRVNQKYLQELGMNLSEKEIIQSDLLASLDDNGRKMYIDMLDKAIATMDEQECELWRNIESFCCGSERMCIRTTVRMIGKSDGNYLFYAMIRNVTSEKIRFYELEDMDKRFRMASEQVNIYFWEYNIATKEMRPCFRCMRDLGLPALVTNYPEPLIEVGIIPQDYADMYRGLMKRVDAGDTDFEAIVPLTAGRVPFRMKYTIEFDENDRPVKAYGSAALVKGVMDDLVGL